jgi:hypothetical protein
LTQYNEVGGKEPVDVFIAGHYRTTFGIESRDEGQAFEFVGCIRAMSNAEREPTHRPLPGAKLDLGNDSEKVLSGLEAPSDESRLQAELDAWQAARDEALRNAEASLPE